MDNMKPPAPANKSQRPRKFFIILLAVFVVVGFVWWHTEAANSGQISVKSQAQAVAKVAPNYCANNTLSQNIIVSISVQHLWACSGSHSVYDSAVITGMENYPADLTPTGVYHIYAKETDQTLTGHDSTGSWSDPVSYWMPFLDNQYGEYGFHDATWRSPADFGNINIYNPHTDAEHGSHGCVELPLATAKWLYNWSSIGTTVTVEG
jgi:hypothetical protein